MAKMVRKDMKIAEWERYGLSKFRIVEIKQF